MFTSGSTRGPRCDRGNVFPVTLSGSVIEQRCMSHRSGPDALAAVVVIGGGKAPIGEPGGTRTHDLEVKNLSLLTAELPAHEHGTLRRAVCQPPICRTARGRNLLSVIPSIGASSFGSGVGTIRDSPILADRYGLRRYGLGLKL